MYSRRQYKVSVTYRSVPVYRPYRTFKKKCLARPYRFILLGVTQYYCCRRSEYRVESSSMWIFLVCLLLLFFPPVSYSAVPLHSVDCLCSYRLLIASLLASFALVRRLLLLFSLIDLGGVRRKMARKNCYRINAVKTVNGF